MIDRKPWQRLLSNIVEVLNGAIPIVGKGKVGYMVVGEGEAE